MPAIDNTRIGSNGTLSYNTTSGTVGIVSAGTTTAAATTTTITSALTNVAANNVGAGFGLSVGNVKSGSDIALNFRSLEVEEGLDIIADNSTLTLRVQPDYVNNIVATSLSTFVLYGSGIPSSSLGVDGQIYIDLTTPAFYPPKVGGYWPSGIAFGGGVSIPVPGALDFGQNGNIFLSAIL